MEWNNGKTVREPKPTEMISYSNQPLDPLVILEQHPFRPDLHIIAGSNWSALQVNILVCAWLTFKGGPCGL